MTAVHFLGFSTLAISIATALWAIYRDKTRDKAKEGRDKSNDDAKLRDDQREWYEAMSKANKEMLVANSEMLRRVESLEQDRISDHRMIADLRNYVRRLVNALERGNVPVPPASKSLGIE